MNLARLSAGAGRLGEVGMPSDIREHGSGLGVRSRSGRVAEMAWSFA